MRTILWMAAIAMCTGAFADGHETKTYVYATYANCDIMAEEAGDKTFEKHYAPVYQKLQEDGDISGWGFLKHHTGGKWRRLTYHMGTSVSAVLAATKKLGDTLEEDLSPRNDDYGKACQTHQDYIWQMKVGSADDERGSAGVSVYMVCDMSREERADEIVMNEFAGAYDKYVSEGKLTSWGWMSHIMGGKYRRILTTSAADVDSLMKARAELLEKFAGTSASREFVSICGSHEDYIWNIAMEGR